MYFGLWKSNTWLWRGDIGPFLFNKLAIPVGLVIPIGSAFLAFLASYGLMEFIGVLVDPFMRPVLKLCGENLWAGLKMAFGVIPAITSVGLLGLWLAEFTPLFDWFGYLFYPFFKVFGVPQAALGARRRPCACRKCSCRRF